MCVSHHCSIWMVMQGCLLMSFEFRVVTVCMGHASPSFLWATMHGSMCMSYQMVLGAVRPQLGRALPAMHLPDVFVVLSCCSARALQCNCLAASARSTNVRRSWHLPLTPQCVHLLGVQMPSPCVDPHCSVQGCKKPACFSLCLARPSPCNDTV